MIGADIAGSAGPANGPDLAAVSAATKEPVAAI